MSRPRVQAVVFAILLSSLAGSGCDSGTDRDPGGIAPPPGAGNLVIDYAGVWQVTEVLSIDGDATRAPDLGEVLVFDSDRLLSFGSTDTSAMALAVEAGPVEDYVNTVGPQTSQFFVVLGFGGQRLAEIGIASAAESEDVLLIDLVTTVTDPTTVRLRALRTELDAGEAPEPPQISLSVNDRAGVFVVSQVAPPTALPPGQSATLPATVLPPLEGSLVEVDFEGRVATVFGLDPFDPIPPGAVIDTLLSRATGREILAQRSLIDVFGTESSLSLRASVLDPDRLAGSFFDRGVLFVDLGVRSVGADLVLDRVDQPPFCFGIQEGRWDFALTQGTNPVLDLSNGPSRSTRVRQLQCVAQLEIVEGQRSTATPLTRSALTGGIELDGSWAPTPSGPAFADLQDLRFDGAFVSSTNYVGTWTSSNLGSGQFTGTRRPE